MTEKTERSVFKLFSSALDEDREGNIVLRGVMAPESLSVLKVGSYQREVLSHLRIEKLKKAFDTGNRIPDIELGMRGGNFKDWGDGSFELLNDIYIIDGLQRTTAPKRSFDEGVTPRLGCIVYFNTTEEWERTRFQLLNTTGARLSPNVIIRNMEKDFNIVELLHSISKDKSFVLGGKVCWNQRMLRTEELISARTFLNITGELHYRFKGLNARVGGTRGGSAYRDLIINLEKLYIRLGRGTIRDNIKEFWNVADEAFKIKHTVYRERAPHVTEAFLRALARLFSEYDIFWKDAKLDVPKKIVEKLSTFPVFDPSVQNLTGSGGAACVQALCDLLEKHINKGKSANRLLPENKFSAQKKNIIENDDNEVLEDWR